MRKFLVLLFFCTIATAGAQGHGLSNDQVNLLKALGAPVYVPSFLPDNFTVISVEAKIERPGVGRGKAYTIVYEGPNRKAFVVESTPGGIGGPAGDQSFPGESKAFGPTSVEYFKSLSSEGKSFTAGSWLGKGPFFRACSISPRSEHSRMYDKTVSPQTMLKVHCSLMPLK